MTSSVPVIDIASAGTSPHEAADRIATACREHGFFYLMGHGVRAELPQRLADLSRQFFDQADSKKMRLDMQGGGRAWRGYFPLGGELTSGRPDAKEGLYFGTELDEAHALVRARTPLHGSNLFPEIQGFRQTVLDYIDTLTDVGHTLTELLAVGLGLNPDYFHERYTHDPLVLLRVFHYPPLPEAELWSVGEHTDYGFLTLLWQDDSGGLQVKSGSTWIDVPPVPDSFVCNIGDMLDRMTGGLYRSTPHRVRNTSGRGRLSIPFFFDPNYHSEIEPVVSTGGRDDKSERWDRTSVHEFEGTYGDYILSKVSKVFPQLRADVLDD